MEILNRKDAKYSPQDLLDVFSIVMNKGVEIGKDHSMPSQRTIEMFGDMNKKLDSIHSALYGVEGEGGLIEKVKSIEAQTKKTNGSVSGLKMWKYGLTSAYTIGVAILSFFLIYFAVPAFNSQAQNILQLDKMITVHIAQSK